MKTGLSSYAYFWRLHDQNPSPVSLYDALDDSAQLGADVFQICDYPQIESWSDSQLAALYQHASRLGITLELGTKGIAPAHLRRYLHIAGELDCRLLRTMVNTPDHRPSQAQALDYLTEVLPEFTRQQVAICLETYEQVATCHNVELVRTLDSPWLGICLDPANCVAALEMPDEVVTLTSPWILNWHVKDFAFSRRDGWVGFTLSGCPQGEGLLDYDAIRERIQPEKRNINQIVEHWLPWQGDFATSCETEARWAQHNMQYLLQKNASLTTSDTSKESNHAC
jgi:sugar phosphate isomerase/epimerase